MKLSSLAAASRAFIRNLQRAPEPVRKKWFVVLSAAAAAAVIGGWILSLDFAVFPPAPPEDGAEPAMNGGGKFFETFRKGFEILGSSLSEETGALRAKGEDEWQKLAGQLVNPSVLTLVREEMPLAPETQEPLPVQILPISN